jgi:hypothetical protein
MAWWWLPALGCGGTDGSGAVVPSDYDGPAACRAFGARVVECARDAGRLEGETAGRSRFAVVAGRCEAWADDLSDPSDVEWAVGECAEEGCRDYEDCVDAMIESRMPASPAAGRAAGRGASARTPPSRPPVPEGPPDPRCMAYVELTMRCSFETMQESPDSVPDGVLEQMREALVETCRSMAGEPALEMFGLVAERCSSIPCSDFQDCVVRAATEFAERFTPPTDAPADPAPACPEGEECPTP